MSDREVTREQLHAYLEDALTDIETARVERSLRDSEPARELLREVRDERDRGEHSVGGIWRAERLSCPTREQLSNYLLDAIGPAEQEYVRFHLTTVACLVCAANLEDLRAMNDSCAADVQERRQRFFQSSAGALRNQAVGEAPKS